MNSHTPGQFEGTNGCVRLNKMNEATQNNWMIIEIAEDELIENLFNYTVLD